MNISSLGGVAPAPSGGNNRSLANTISCMDLESTVTDNSTFVYRFACILKAKPVRPPVIVLSAARTESEARENLMKGFEGKMRLIWAGRLPRKQCARGG